MGAQVLVARCTDCGTLWDMGPVPKRLVDALLRGAFCQASIGNVRGEDKPVSTFPAWAELMPVVRTEQGITPVRPCRGRLVPNTPSKEKQSL